MEEFVTQKEHIEFAKRMEEEHNRQNHRITQLEDESRQTRALVVSVERMAISMENMAKEQKRQGDRLDELESVPLERSKQIRNAVITALVSGIVGAILGAVLQIL